MSKKKITTELSTKVVRLDVDVILRNYNKPEFWKKEWLIFKSNIFEIYARIYSIDVKKNQIQMEVYKKSDYTYCKKLNRRIYSYSYFANTFTIPIGHSDYSKHKFQKDLLAHALKLICDVEEKMIINYQEYKNASELEEEYKEKLKSIAEEFLDQEGVSNKDIREAYIDSYIDKCDIPNYTYDVLKNYRYTVIPYEYLMLTAFFNDKEKYDEYCELTQRTIKSTKIKIWLDQRKLDTEEFVEEMKDLLEEV
ncbi:MAG TPA: hypothetical protein PKV66_00850 [Candidatus Pelethenecus sp.]|nr:hypothetical protein [Candidatus Pelethenecus sp.]